MTKAILLLQRVISLILIVFDSTSSLIRLGAKQVAILISGNAHGHYLDLLHSFYLCRIFLRLRTKIDTSIKICHDFPRKFSENFFLYVTWGNSLYIETISLTCVDSSEFSEKRMRKFFSIGNTHGGHYFGKIFKRNNRFR